MTPKAEAAPTPTPKPPLETNSAPWTIQRLLVWTAQHFTEKGIDAPRLTAELLLGHALSLSRVQLYMEFPKPLRADELATFKALVKQRDARVPTQHLLGVSQVYGRDFKVDRRALIPRPETELLIEACATRKPARILELGPGTGIISLSLLAELPEATAAAVELSPDAAALCRENAAKLGVEGRFDLREGDLFAPLAAGEVFDLVVSNPPYVESAVIAALDPEVRDHDPRLALDGGPDGLSILRRIASAAPSWLTPGGTLALEIGDDQGPAVRELLAAAGFTNVSIAKDYSDLDRLAFGTKP